MTKDTILTRLDAIAGRMQEMDYLHSWTEAQLAEHEALCFEHDELMAALREAA